MCGIIRDKEVLHRNLHISKSKNAESFYICKSGEAADIEQYLDGDKIAEEAQYDGLYAVCTDLLDDDVNDILKVSEGRLKNVFVL